MALTEKQKAFCREYFSNGGNATDAYLTAYDSNSPVSAAQEGYRLLQNNEITNYIKSLNAPLERKAISERDKKRSICWSEIERCIAERDSNGAARWMDILNKMDSEYININRNIQDDQTAISNLDTNTLRLIVNDK